MSQKGKAGRDLIQVGRDFNNVVGVERLKYMSWLTIITALLGLIAGITSSLLALKELNVIPKPQPTSIEQPQQKRFP